VVVGCRESRQEAHSKKGARDASQWSKHVLISSIQGRQHSKLRDIRNGVTSRNYVTIFDLFRDLEVVYECFGQKDEADGRTS
jgi:hypothetical protein